MNPTMHQIWDILEGLERIPQGPGVMGGRPCIRGMRVTVGMIVGRIERVIFTSEESDYTIAKVRVFEKSDLVSVAGNITSDEMIVPWPGMFSLMVRDCSGGELEQVSGEVHWRRNP